MTVALAFSLLLAAVPAPVAPCAAASGRIPEDVLDGAVLGPVESYRGMWRSFCSKSSRTRSLAPVLEAAEALAKTPALYDAATGRNPALWLPALEVDDETDSLLVRYTTFIEVAANATAEDRAFLPEYVSIAGDVVSDVLPPWIGHVDGSGFSTCLKLGEVDWIDVARRIEALRGKAISASYRKRADHLAEWLVETFDKMERGVETCGCNENSGALDGLDALARGGRTGGPIVRRLAVAAGRASAAIRQSRVTILWDRSSGRVGGCADQR
jgi:hypothetical protein